MVKRLVVTALSLTLVALYAWDKSKFVSTLQSVTNPFFELLSSNPVIIYLLGTFVFTFILLLWRSRRNVALEI